MVPWDGAFWTAGNLFQFMAKKSLFAQIRSLGGFSAHAGQQDLLGWLSVLASCKPQVVLTHGEDSARETLAAHVYKRFGLAASMPHMRDVIEL